MRQGDELLTMLLNTVDVEPTELGKNIMKTNMQIVAYADDIMV